MENREVQVIAKYEIAYNNKIYYAGEKFMMLEKDLEGEYKNDVIIAEEEIKKQSKKSKKTE